MKELLIFFIGLLLFAISNLIPAQAVFKNSSVTGVCYAGNKVTQVYIPPPASFFKNSGSKGGASITVYYTGFSTSGKDAIEFAVSILRRMLPADTKLTILASWERISTSGVLAQSSTTGYVGGWTIDAFNPNALYPVALAEKIAGESLNTDLEGDITLSVNSSVNWYLGIDGKTPQTMYDLVTVALHEICHGLGFFDSMNTDATQGWFGMSSVPAIYDTFVENFAGASLTDTAKFHNFSSVLKTQLTGGQLYFNGPLLKKYSVSKNYPSSRAKLYVPSTWDSGSSVSHLDESAAILQVDALMTPFIDKAEAIHDPGKLTFSILGDLGWINTRIIHTPMRDTEKHISQVVLSTSIKSDTTFNRDNVGLVYSFDNFKSSDTIILTSPGGNNSFRTTLDIPSYDTELQYYLYTQDCFSRIYRSPSLIGLYKYKVYFGTDTVKPVIAHTKTDYYLRTIDTISFKASVTDNLGVDSAYVEYRINDSPSKFIGLKAGLKDSYSAFIVARQLSLKGGDSIRYRIFAIDSANHPNNAVLPKTGYFTTKIEDITSPIISYSTDFSGAAPDFFNIGFEVAKPAGFQKYGLHTKHPYESPEDNNKSIEYTSILRHPLKFNESGIVINFNEVVLVEPGETGSVFGSSDFYDYVIVEGSKNFGKTWFALADGYDSRVNSVWLSDYNSLITGQNSTYVGSESKLQKHTIFYKPSDKISAGDTLLLRFRLFSDPFANGWGWLIEDLQVNSLVDAVEKTNLNLNRFLIYPNPGNGQFKIVNDMSGQIKSIPFHYSIYNSKGNCIIKTRDSGGSEISIDISGYPSDIYIIVLYLDDGIKTFKYSLIK